MSWRENEVWLDLLAAIATQWVRISSRSVAVLVDVPRCCRSRDLQFVVRI